jgi:putative ABC transport system permease protein
MSAELLRFTDRVKRDSLYGVRQLLRARSFAFAAIATLAIGIGATAAVCSLVEAVVLRPFPFADPDRVVNVHPKHDGAPLVTSSNLEFATWRALPRTFGAIVATIPQVSLTLAHGDQPEVVTGARTTWALREVLGVAPELGRAFTATDDQPGAPKVVMLSHKLWLRDYNGSRTVLGQQLRLDDEAYTVIGVMPSSLDPVSSGTEVWIPLALTSTDLLDFKARNLQLVARLVPGVTTAQAAAAVDASEQRLAKQYPMWGNGYTGAVSLYSEDMIGNLRTRLFILFGAVAFVFLIACANVANLLLARGTARTREMGIRTALGATRRRLVGQLLTESVVLWATAAAIGAALAVELVHGLVAASPAGVPRIEQAQIDAPVLLFTLVTSALCSLVVALLPAVRAANPALEAALRDGGRGIGQGRARERARAILVTAEVALAMALLTGAGLLVRTAWGLSHVDPGFDSDHVLSAQVVLPTARYGSIVTATQTYRAVRDELGRTPGVVSAALTSTLPLTPAVRAGIGAEGQPLIDGERLIASVHPISPDYFATMKIRVIGGRDFLQTDNASAPNVAIINETLARKFWPGQDAIGKRMEGMDPSHQHFMQVIAVVADPRDVSLDQRPEPEFYIPFEQAPPALWAGIQGYFSIVARTVPNPATMDRSIRRAVDAIDPSLPVASIIPMNAIVRTSIATARFNTILLSVLAAIALLLASVGVYGVVTYSVGQRTREIGLRMALGATPLVIAALVARGALIPTLAGAALGSVLSAFTTGVLRDQLFGVAPHDPTVLASIAMLLVVVSLFAAYLPARRAMRMSATKALAG